MSAEAKKACDCPTIMECAARGCPHCREAVKEAHRIGGRSRRLHVDKACTVEGSPCIGKATP